MNDLSCAPQEPEELAPGYYKTDTYERDNRWGVSEQGPCPDGWRVPTSSEWNFLLKRGISPRDNEVNRKVFLFLMIFLGMPSFYLRLVI